MERFELNIPARLISSDAQVEDVLIAFTVDGHGYRLMIEFQLIGLHDGSTNHLASPFLFA
jgi:hypothetical protein